MENKSNKAIIIILSIIIAVLAIGIAVFAVFIYKNNISNKDSATKKLESAIDEKVTGKGSVKESDSSSPIVGMSHKMLINGNAEDLYDTTLVPSVADYTVNPDLSNISNLGRFYNYDGTVLLISPEQINALVQDYFFVDDASYDEFFEIYESNRYDMVPNFITVDSLMHTYHLYFAYLLKNTEKNYLIGALKVLSEDMYNECANAYSELKGTEYEEAALRNVQYFAVAGKLLEANINVDPSISGKVDEEYALIMAAQGPEESPVLMMQEDYSQYKPRGYYAGDPELEKYFRAMMWYGRMSFTTDDEELSKSALIMTLSMDKAGFENWEKIYTVTSFFAGAADDLGYYEYLPAIDETYGEVNSYSDVVGKDKEFSKFLDAINKMDPPRINSIIVCDGDDNVVRSFRFMGQRFSVDETIFSNLTYSNLPQNDSGEKRMLPDTLDVMAALGSDTALTILEEEGKINYPDYHKNLQMMVDEFNNSDGTIWNASLYASWLNTLRPLLEEKGAGYPKYMQSHKWSKKNLETFAGSYAELKHDTILYSKQTMAEMGDGGEDFWFDDRGYVDPQVKVYAQFALLSKATYDGLNAYGMISDADRENLNRLTTIAETLIKISEKELVNETLTDEEYEFIRCYGGDLEHFWYEVNKTDEYYLSYAFQAPAPIVADIASDPNGTALEIGTGGIDRIYVVVPVAGELKLATGSVFSFYQFTVPLSDRLTDEEWRKRVGVEYSEEYGYGGDPNLRQPDWTQDYRCSWN